MRGICTLRAVDPISTDLNVVLSCEYRGRAMPPHESWAMGVGSSPRACVVSPCGWLAQTARGVVVSSVECTAQGVPKETALGGPGLALACARR